MNANFLIIQWSLKCLLIYSHSCFVLVEIKTNEAENDQNSILSADDSSSGYESFKAMKDIDK